MTVRRLPVIIAALTAFGLLVVAGLVFLLLGSRPDLTQQELLLTRDEWRAGTGAMPYTSEEEFPLSGDDATLVRRFKAPVNNTLRQEVTVAANPGFARIGFAWERPEGGYRDFGPVEELTAEYQLAGPDSLEVFCGQGDVAACRTWIFHARYGQYLIKLIMSNEAPLAQDDFRRHVVALNDTMNARL